MAIKKYYDSDCNLGVLDGKTQAERNGCWEPQPGQWQRVSADGEV